MPQRTRRAACHHRVWRLARLLTPDRALARELFVRIAEERPDLPHLHPTRLDRLVILRARELVRNPPKRYRAPEPPPDAVDSLRPPDPLGSPLVTEAMATVHTLPRQSMEAWMLRHVDQLGEIAISRAMDCSRTALTRHLEQADQAMRARLDDRADEAVQALRDAIDGLDPAPAVQLWRSRRRRRWIARLALGTAAAAALLLLLSEVWNSAWVQQGLDALLTWLEQATTDGG